MNVVGTNTGHGHVWPRPDGMVARCGGAAICSQCAKDQAQVAAEAAKQERADEEMIGHYSAALDEIRRLRSLAAYEAAALEKVLDMATLPRTANRHLRKLRERLLDVACGRADVTLAEVSATDRRAALVAAGAPPGLTRHQWEERDRRV